MEAGVISQLVDKRVEIIQIFEAAAIVYGMNVYAAQLAR
jgi:hypothetical protein